DVSGEARSQCVSALDGTAIRHRRISRKQTLSILRIIGLAGVAQYRGITPFGVAPTLRRGEAALPQTSCGSFCLSFRRLEFAASVRTGVDCPALLHNPLIEIRTIDGAAADPAVAILGVEAHRLTLHGAGAQEVADLVSCFDAAIPNRPIGFQANL